MISLNVQLKLIIFSFIFGFFFSAVLKFLNGKKSKYKNIINFIFLFVMTIVYFIGIQKISNGILHIYSVLCIVVGYILYELIEKYNKK